MVSRLYELSSAPAYVLSGLMIYVDPLVTQSLVPELINIFNKARRPELIRSIKFSIVGSIYNNGKCKIIAISFPKNVHSLPFVHVVQGSDPVFLSPLLCRANTLHEFISYNRLDRTFSMYINYQNGKLQKFIFSKKKPIDLNIEKIDLTYDYSTGLKFTESRVPILDILQGALHSITSLDVYGTLFSMIVGGINYIVGGLQWAFSQHIIWKSIVPMADTSYAFPVLFHYINDEVRELRGQTLLEFYSSEKDFNKYLTLLGELLF